MNNFSFQRIKLLLKADYTEYKIYLYYALGAFAAIISVAFIIMNMEDTERGKLQIQYSLFWLMLFSCSTYFCQYVGRKVHEYKNTYLTLPARTSEKYVVILLEGFLLLLLLYLLFTGCMHFPLLFRLNYPITGNSLLTGKLSPFVAMFLIALMFLAYLSFRKYAFLVTIGGYIGIMASFYLFLGCFGGRLTHNLHQASSFFEMTPFSYTLEWLVRYHPVSMTVATIIILYIGYLKLKGKEAR